MTATYQVLITGTNRGIGLEFVKQYAQDGRRVFACCRDPEYATDLQTLANLHSNIQILSLDVSDFKQIDALALQLKDEKIDLLINNAGVYPDGSMGNVDPNDWLTDMQRFNQYLTLADQLASVATKEDLAECARLLAINIAHYESVYGALPLDETLEMAYSDKPNQPQIDLMTRGMETMVGVLGGIVQGFDENPHH